MYKKYFWVICVWGLFIEMGWAQEPIQELQRLDSLGKLYWQRASYNLALSCCKKALPIAERIEDIKWQARILTLMGVVCENKGDFEASFKYHFKALRLKEQIGDKAEWARSCLNIGITYYSSGQIEKSTEFYQKTLQLNKEATKPRASLKTHALYHLSTNYRTLKQYEKAEAYAQQALEYAIKIDEKVIIIDAQNGLGLIATEQGEYAKGRAYYQKVYDLAYQTEDGLILTNTLLHFAENYTAQKDYATAIMYAQKSLALAQKHELKAEERLAYDLLASLHRRQGAFELAYQYQAQGFALKDSLFNLQKSQQIAELTVEYETEKKTQQIQLLEKDKRINQNTILGLFLILLLLILLAVLLFYRYKVQKTLLTLQKTAQERLQEHIGYQERELASSTLHIFQKNEMLNTLQEKLNDLSPEVKAQVKPLLQDVRNSIDLDKNWENFQRHFVEVHPKFFDNLLEAFSTLSQTELKMLAYIRMKMSNKEVASLMNIATKSVEMSRYRLKKKFGLGTEDSLDRWLEEL